MGLVVVPLGRGLAPHAVCMVPCLVQQLLRRRVVTDPLLVRRWWGRSEAVCELRHPRVEAAAVRRWRAAAGGVAATVLALDIFRGPEGARPHHARVSGVPVRFVGRSRGLEFVGGAVGVIHEEG